MATMADVARSAGVSVATVSHVLNGTRPVLPHTRQAVLDAVEELGYTTNTLARSLVTARTRSIGLAVSAISNPYFTEILQGVEASALEHGYSLLIADPHDDPEHERKVVQMLHERRVDGVIVAPSADPRGLLAYLGRHDVPAVFLDRLVDAPDGGPRFDQVCADSAEPTSRLVTHLAGLGHRRIGLVAGRPGLSTTSERITGYRTGLAFGGLPYDERLLVHGDSESAGAEQATAALLSLAVPPTALVTGEPCARTACPCPATSRCAASTTSPGRTCSRPGSPRSRSPAGTSAPRPYACCWNVSTSRTGPPRPCGSPAPSSTARRAAAPRSRHGPRRRGSPCGLSSSTSPSSPRSPRKEPSHDRRRR
jgi:LacI family transcriptional regulator